jgi:hypothetical protein
MIFIDNKYTRIYYTIITRARNRITTEKTESHHIVPESFYLTRARKGRKGWLEGNANVPENKVDLTLHEHFVCHLLLTKMVNTPEAQYKVDSAAAWLMDAYLSNNKDVRITGRLYTKLRTAASLAQSKRRKGMIGTTVNTKAWTNGTVQKFSITCPGPDFYHGSLNKGKSSKLKGVPRPAEVCNSIAKSHIGKPGTVTGKIKWNNGIKVMYSITQPGTEWVVGGLDKGDKFAVQKGKRHWNNGTVSKMSFDCPGPDFVLGRIVWAKNI